MGLFIIQVQIAILVNIKLHHFLYYLAEKNPQKPGRTSRKISMHTFEGKNGDTLDRRIINSFGHRLLQGES